MTSKLELPETSFPPLVNVFTVHYICNGKCLYCPVGKYNAGELGQIETGEFDPKKRIFLPWSIFEKVAREMASHPESILRFHGRGEPLMHPKLVEMVRFAKEIGVGTVTCFTNGILMTEDTAKALLEAGIDLVEFSLDAYSRELYEKLRRTPHFDTVVENILRMIKIRDDLGKRARIVVSAVDHAEFQAERSDFEEFWNEHADMVITRILSTFGGRIEYGRSLGPQPRRGEIVPCPQLWTRFNVAPSGKVVFCPNDWADEDVVGDLNDGDATIFSMWNSQEYRDVRAKYLRGEFILECCKNCADPWEGRWEDSYEKMIERLGRSEGRDGPVDQEKTSRLAGFGVWERKQG